MIALMLLALGGGLLYGCAENRSHLLPGTTVEQISANLDRVRELADRGDCTGAVDAAQQVTRQIEGLGTEVDPRLKRSLRVGASQLVLVIQESCGAGLAMPPPVTPPETATGTGTTGPAEPATGATAVTGATGTQDGTQGTEPTPDTTSPPSTGDGSTGGGTGGGTGDSTGGGTGGTGTGTGGIGPGQ